MKNPIKMVEKTSLKYDYDYLVYLLLFSPIFIEIILFTLSYFKRHSLTSQDDQYAEFNECQRNVWTGFIMLTFSMTGHLTQIQMYGKILKPLPIICSRFLSILITVPFLNLYRKNEMTTVTYFHKRFKHSLFSCIAGCVSTCYILYKLNMSMSSLVLVTNAFGMDATVQVTLWIIYSSVMIAVGGLRGWLWIGALRYILVLSLQSIVFVYAILKLSHDGSFNDTQLYPLLSSKSNLNEFSNLFVLTIDTSISFLGTAHSSIYYNAAWSNRKAKLSIYSSIIPFALIVLTASSIETVMFMYYLTEKCDPVGDGEVSRELLPFTFLSNDEHRLKTKVFQILYAISMFLWGISSIPNAIFILWLQIRIFWLHLKRFRFDHISVYGHQSHLIFAVGVMICVYYTAMRTITSRSVFHWLPRQLENLTLCASSTVTILMFLSAMVPHLTNRTVWLVPLVMIGEYFVTKFQSNEGHSYLNFQDGFSYFCQYQDKGCHEKCRYSCERFDITFAVMSLVLSTLMTLVSFFYATDSTHHRNYDEDLYLKIMLDMWKKIYMKRRIKERKKKLKEQKKAKEGKKTHKKKKRKKKKKKHNRRKSVARRPSMLEMKLKLKPDKRSSIAFEPKAFESKRKKPKKA